MSDNGPQFTSVEFDVFLKANGIQHICSAPYHPQSNGEAERFVQTFKNVLKTGKQDEGDVQMKLSRFLLSYHTTPNSTTGLTPSELFLKRQIRTRLDMLKPKVAEHFEIIKLYRNSTMTEGVRCESLTLDRTRDRDGHTKFYECSGGVCSQ